MTKDNNGELPLKTALKIVKDAEIRKDKQDKEKLSKWIDSIIGKVYVYRNNSYSRPLTKEDYWDSYHWIIGKINDNTILIQEWSLINPKERQCEIKQHQVYCSTYYADGRKGFNGMPFCSLKEFNQIRKKITRMLECLVINGDDSK